ncbi:MAG: PHP domain-containing protein [Lachnospiraceae bacterium]|jgi:predicted metal-dependent phosphoesterase TrpH|nr:PHP domain-containing protein [Lachnospiraceae bacterium]MDD3614627.1 PHP domain-containing protein [Lachnospiraceae bacterium]
MEKFIDLHVHSNCSDGTYSPTELVRYAKEKGLSAFALTDHDTTEGIAEALSAAREYDMELIPGIELSTNYEGRDIHMLGLGIDTNNMDFQKKLLAFQDSRDIRNQKIIERLREYGIDISHEKMLKEFRDGVWTRAHFGRYLLDHGYVKDMNDAFNKYIGDKAPCFVPREKVTPFQAVSLIHEGGGYAVLAHPLLYHFKSGGLEKLVNQLCEFGLDGLEAIYSTNRFSDDSNMKLLAKRHSLKITGGSDFHGSNKPFIDLGSGRGNLKIPYELWLLLTQDPPHWTTE